MSIEAGQQLLHYRLIEKIGEGGMGQVWLALDTQLQRNVAVKLPSARLTGDEVDLRRFKHEARAAAAIDHPFVCKVYEVGCDRGIDFIAMEYVDGTVLSQELRSGALPLERALALTEEILEALVIAHERGIVHRDLKPDNVMLAGGHVKVMDFGLAGRASHSSDPDADTVTRLTRAGMTVGTIPYMSPEQLRGGDVDPRSDLFALGVMLQEMLTGTHPFRRTTSADTSAAILNAPAGSLQESNPELPARLQPVVDRLLAKDQDSRFASAAEALAELRAVRVAERAATDSKKSRRSRTATVATLLAIVLVAALFATRGLLGTRGRDRARATLPEIQRLADAGEYVEAYRLAEQVEAKLSADPELDGLWPVIADRLTLVTDPPGARVHLQAVPRPGVQPAPPARVGATPLEDLRLARSDYRATIELAGYAPVERMISSRFNRGEAPFGADPGIRIDAVLTPAAELPAGTVFVPGGEYSLVAGQARAMFQDLYIDAFEVSNRDFAEFVQAGGYSDPSYWPASMSIEGHERPFAEAVRTLTDRSGLQSPRGWSNQQFPAGRDDHPATGVTWYEAAAYCAFRGKSLPDVFEWEKSARGGNLPHFEGAYMPWGQTRVEEANLRANFLGAGTDPVRAHPFGISPYGAYNMAGNVEEWLLNPREPGYATAGGSWADPAYNFHRFGARPADHSSESIGFRCARSVDGQRERRDPWRLEPRSNAAAMTPVDEQTFEGFRSHYRYDTRPAAAETLERIETADWIREKISFDGVGGERALAYLWLPRRGQAPFQVINYVVSSTVFFSRTAAEEVESILAPQIKSGRAVLAVVPKGAVERPWPGLTGGTPGHAMPGTVGERDERIIHVAEFRMGLDYLETRDEIDATRIAHAGFSWGACNTAVVLVAVEPRIRSTVFIGGGVEPVSLLALPEANAVNFAPRVRSPVLMLNGLYDEVMPAETAAKSLFALLPEPKRLELVEAGHLPNLEIRTPIINGWLDETLGPVGP